jgi:hypothetical protein
MAVCYGAAPVIDSKVEVVSHVHDMMGLLGVERIRTMTHRRWQIDDGFHDGSVHQRRRKVGNCRARGFFEDEMWSESTGAIARSFFLGAWSKRICGRASGQWRVGLCCNGVGGRPCLGEEK